jgi:hypothetical protein
MSNSDQNFILTRFLTVLVICLFGFNVFCQPPPPPPNMHGSTGNSAPGSSGGAPIGSGIWILITLACSYGTYTQIRNNERNTSAPAKTDTKTECE